MNERDINDMSKSVGAICRNHMTPEFTIVRHGDPDVVTRQVSELLSLGWHLHGEIFILPKKDLVCQALVLDVINTLN